MKKIFIILATMAACIGVNAEDTYNYFEAADVDSDGWLWLDTKEKLNKYCGFNTKTKTFKVQLTAANYEDDDFNYPEPTLSATVVGYNENGVKGGEGAKTGGIILPIAKDFHYIMNDKSFGGGVAFTLPDLAELDLYLSIDQKEAFMAVYASDGNIRYQDASNIMNYWHGEGMTSLHNPVPGINNCGVWENIQETRGYNINTEDFDTITHEPGKPVTIYLPSLTDGHEVIIHGIKLLTYTNTIDDTGVNELEAVENTKIPVYNLFGQPVDDSYKGIVIKNGQKIIRK